MNNAEIELTYTALAECIARVGEPRRPCFLATLALDLLSQQQMPRCGTQAYSASRATGKI